MALPANQSGCAASGGEKQVGRRSRACDNFEAEVVPKQGCGLMQIGTTRGAVDDFSLADRFQSSAVIPNAAVLQAEENDAATVGRQSHLGTPDLLFPTILSVEPAKLAGQAIRNTPHDFRRVADDCIATAATDLKGLHP